MRLPQIRATELGQLLRLAGPLAAIYAGNQLIAVVDTAVVGRLGAVELAGVGLANGLYFAISTLGMGVMLGLDPLVSQALGAGEPQRARALLWQGVWLALLVSTALTVPLALTPSLLVPFGIEPEVAAQARIYLHLRLVGLFPFYLYLGMRAYLQAMGRTRPMVVSMICANLFNAVADVLLVLGGSVLPAWAGPLRNIPGYGVAGAAWATNLCLVLQVGIVLFAIRNMHETPTTAEQRRLRLRELLRALRVGLPVGLQLMAEVAVFALVGLLAGRMGADQMAAHQVSLMLASVAFTVAVGIGSAGSVRVGRAIGAADLAGTRRAGRVAFIAGGGFMALSATSFLIFPRSLAGLLTSEAHVIEAAVPLLAIASLFAISDGVQAVGAGVLRGAGDTRFAFLANLVGHWAIGLPVALLLAFHWGLGIHGLWLGLSAGLTAVATALFLRFRKLSSRPIRPLGEAPADEIRPAA